MPDLLRALGRNSTIHHSHTFTFSRKEQKCYHFHFLLEGTKIHTLSCQLSQIFGKIVTRYIFNHLPGGFEMTLSFSWSNFPTFRAQFVTYDIHNASLLYEKSKLFPSLRNPTCDELNTIMAEVGNADIFHI